MDPALIWLVAGFALVILELLTGTFYLLVIGAGAFAGALAAWLGGPFLAQAVASCAVALVGTFAVRRWHVAHQESGVVDNLLDRGQPVVLESWTDEATGLARVRYRGASWDARVAAPDRPAPGATLFIAGQEGNTLLIGPAPQTP